MAKGVVSIFSVLLALSGGPVAEDLDRDGVIRLGGDYGYPPYEYLDEEGRAVGFNVALVRAIADDLGLEVETDLGPWERRRRGIETGELDILPMFISEERAQVADFATPHVMIYHEIFVRRGGSSIGGLADLANREVIVQRAAYTHEYLQSELPEAAPVLVETERDAIRLLAAGRYDAALVSVHGGRRVIRELDLEDVTTSGRPVLPVEYALAVTKGNTALLDAIESAMLRLRRSGEFDRLYERWLAGDAGLGWNDVLRYAAVVLAMALGLCLLAVAWIWSLRRQVVARTLALERELDNRRRTESILREKEADARAVFEHAGVGMARVDEDGCLFAINTELADMLGRSEQELLDTPLVSLCAPHDADVLSGYLSGDHTEPLRAQLQLRHGSTGPVRIAASLNPLIVEGREKTYFLFVAQDLSEVHRLTEELDFHSRRDPVTELFNRQEFEMRLTRLIGQMRDSRRESSLIHLDTDQFKLINETRDHASGDRVLQQIGLRLRMMLGPDDIVARLGGDEFGVLLPDTPGEQAVRVAETIRGRMESHPFRLGEDTFRLTVSVAVVPIDGTVDSAADVLRQADAACYAAKEEGRNRVHLYQPDDERLAERQDVMRWAREVDNALNEDRFELYFQTIERVDGSNGERVSLEVLLRMINHDGQPVSAGLFMPAAERYSLAQRVDRWVVDHLMTWLEEHVKGLDNLGMVTVNLSGRSLGDEDFLTSLAENVTRSGIDPHMLCFEITETAAIANLAEASLGISRIRALGCGFALDDFGIGASSMAYLKHLPTDFLKIDGSFVRDIAHDACDRAMVTEINDLGHLMGMITIAEHAENEEVLAQLRAIGVDMAQGYQLSRPAPLETLPGVCRQRKAGEKSVD